MRLGAAIFGLLLAVALPAAGAPADELFAAGNAAYASGEFARAVELYRQALESGGEPPALHYNLGCALFADSRLGEAVLAFERARLYTPRFADLDHNLRVLREQFLADRDLLKEAADGEGAIHRLVAGLSENEWIALTATLFWLTLGALWIRLFAAHALVRMLSLYAFLSLGFLLLCAGGLCAMKLHENRPGSRAIVLAPELAVQQTPGGRDATLFRIHAGAPVRVENRRGEWLFVRLPNGAAGWAPRASLGLVRP